MTKTEKLMNASRRAANAYGDRGKADFNRGRRGRDLVAAKVAEYERLNRKQPVTVYKITVE